MKRAYKVEDFIDIVTKFRKNMPEVTIWTDIIVGYPTEAESDFKETLKLIKETKPDYVNISKFGSRPGTEASKLKQLPGYVIKKRSKELSDMIDKISSERNMRWVGNVCHVLVTEKRSGQYIGRNESYKQVIIETERDIIGKLVNNEFTIPGPVKHPEKFVRVINSESICIPRHIPKTGVLLAATISIIRSSKPDLKRFSIPCLK